MAGHGDEEILACYLWARRESRGARSKDDVLRPKRCAASKNGGVYRSNDAGRSWQRFDKVDAHGTIMSVALHPSDANQVYIGARYQGEIFGTQDGGGSWTAMPLRVPVKDIYCVACG